VYAHAVSEYVPYAVITGKSRLPFSMQEHARVRTIAACSEVRREAASAFCIYVCACPCFCVCVWVCVMC
jgi:hypothetical protein